MATGTGKTVTALLAASQVAQSLETQPLLVVAVPYQHLVDQWAEDLEEFGADPVLAYQSRTNWQPQLERELLEFNQGVRDTCVVVITHRTLSMDAAQRTIKRATGPVMLIADEVHHLGASHTQNALLEQFDLRLGLSATPERWYDEEGTAALSSYFGDTVFEYGLEEAIDRGALCEYYYVPHVVELVDEEMDAYYRLSSKIAKHMNTDEEGEVNLEENPALQQALFKRARLVGTATQKLDILVDLLQRQSDISHSLVYCSDGSTGIEADEGERHVDATTARLRERGWRVERFTARESQAEREQLIQDFEDGEIEILTSIRCLDEGVDIPATRSAYILASTSNPRQYVQRRGRILRTHENKDYAVIHDFVTVPSISGLPSALSGVERSSERRLIKQELERVSTFADAALNHPDADVDGVPTTEGSLQALKRQYDLLDA
jgi:superfamily II DNA or RNA helicase